MLSPHARGVKSSALGSFRCSARIPGVNASRTARERVREEITREITEIARSQLATEGAAGLSLRAIAREMGMVSSAIYRYFPSRDDLLTSLITDAYDAIGMGPGKGARAGARGARPRRRPLPPRRPARAGGGGGGGWPPRGPRGSRAPPAPPPPPLPGGAHAD